MLRVSAGSILLGLLACASTEGVLDLADATGESARREAADEAAKILRSAGDPNRRTAAAVVLGRLAMGGRAVARAAEVGLSPRSPRSVRAATAWALGRIPSADALPILIAGLESGPSTDLSRRILQSILRHEVHLGAADPAVRVRVAEVLVRLSGTLRSDRVPPEVGLLGRVVRDLDVDARVLARAVDAHRRSPGERTRGALYAAAFELLARVRRLRAEAPEALRRGPVAEALLAAGEAAATARDPETARLVHWFLGSLADDPALARVAAGIVPVPTADDGAGERLIRAWALARAQLGALGARRALSARILTEETDPDVLRMVDRSRGDSAEDILQRVLGIEVER